MSAVRAVSPLPRAPRELGGVAHGCAPAAEIDRPARLLLAQHVIDRCPRRARELGELLLRDGHHDRAGAAGGALGVDEVGEAAEHAPLRARVVGVDHQRRHAAHLVGEQCHEHPVDLGVLAA